MPKKNSKPAKPKHNAKKSGRIASATRSGSTASAPSHPSPPHNDIAAHAEDQEALAAAMPSNTRKSSEYGFDNALMPSRGASEEMPSPTAGAGTLSVKNASTKTGPAALMPVSIGGSLSRARVNSADQVLTTNQGVAISDNQNSLKAGLVLANSLRVRVDIRFIPRTERQITRAQKVLCEVYDGLCFTRCAQ
jgi:catalase